MESYHKRKSYYVEEKYGKLITLKQFNDDVGIADTQ